MRRDVRDRGDRVDAMDQRDNRPMRTRDDSRKMKGNDRTPSPKKKE